MRDVIVLFSDELTGPLRSTAGRPGKRYPDQHDQSGHEEVAKQVRKHGDHDQSSHGNWARGLAQTYDMQGYMAPMFETRLELNGVEYYSELTSVKEYTRSIDVTGDIYNADNEAIGSFERSVYRDGEEIANVSLALVPEHQGKGIGLAFVHHWEDQYRKAGFKRMTLAANNVGRYAWAVDGYTWSEPFMPGDMVDHITAFSTWREDPFWAKRFSPQAWDELEQFVYEIEAGENFEPVDVAMLGAGRALEGEEHIGKMVLMTAPSWTGTKEL